MWMNADEVEALEPRQERSRATRRRILAAANQLLRKRPFATLSVQEIATESGCSIGAFYGRFRGKDDLLAPLLNRHYRVTQRGLRRAMASPGWRSMSLQERLEWITRMTVWTFRSRRWLIRALAVYLRQDANQLTDSDRSLRNDFARRSRGLLSDFSSEINHANQDAALDFALFLITTLCRERVLFGELSEHEWSAEGDDAVITEVVSAAHAYLTNGAGGMSGLSTQGIWLGA
ncbi:MAG: TetR/AcrR family transcriptional regulator [Phycisphaerales bacterium]